MHLVHNVYMEELEHRPYPHNIVVYNVHIVLDIDFSAGISASEHKSAFM